MRSATVLALARIVYEFRGQIDSSILAELLQSVIILLKERSREIVKSVLGFVKVCVVSLDKEVWETQIEDIVDGLVIWCNDSKNRFKSKV